MPGSCAPSEEERKAQLAWMEQCYTAWLRLEEEKLPVAEVRDMLRRSWFQGQFVKEIFTGVLAVGFKEVPAEVGTVLRQALGGIGQSKVVDDWIKFISQAAEASANKRLGARGKWQALVRSPVLHGLHN